MESSNRSVTRTGRTTIGAPTEAGMAEPQQAHSVQEEARGLEELLDRVDAAARDHDPTSIGDVLDSVGPRSFAPVLLVAGLVILAPIIGDIPGVPTMMGLVVILVAGQLVLRRECIWLPDWLLDRSIGHEQVEKTVGWLRKPARFIDRWSKPRYTGIVRHAGVHVIALACIVIAAATPLMEVVPFSANVAGAAIVAFGIALMVQDGLIAWIAIVCSLATFWVVLSQFIGSG